MQLAAIGVDSCLEDDGVVDEAVDGGDGHRGIAEDSVMPHYSTGESLRSGWSTRIMRCMAAASRLLIGPRAAGLG